MTGVRGAQRRTTRHNRTGPRTPRAGRLHGKPVCRLDAPGRSRRGACPNALACGDCEWACFAAQQGAEKAVKALLLRRSLEVRGHTLTALLHSEIEPIIWFGSRVTGIPSPGSDVDLCLVLTHSEKALRDRVPDHLPFGFPVGIDLFSCTRAEFDRLRAVAPGWYGEIARGREL